MTEFGRGPAVDKLIIQDVVAECWIGVTEAERAKAQTIWIDLELAIDAGRAAQKDDVRESVNYRRLVTAVRELAERKSCRLMETLAEGIASLVLRQFATPKIRVLVKKRALPVIGYAAV